MGLMSAERLLLSFFFVLFVAFVVKHLVATNGCSKQSVVRSIGRSVLGALSSAGDSVVPREVFRDLDVFVARAFK